MDKTKLIQMIDSYSYSIGDNAVGSQFDVDKVSTLLSHLKSSIIDPYSTKIMDTGIQIQVVTLPTDDDFVVFYDVQSNEFGLGSISTNKHINDINVRGDLVGVWMAQ